MSPEHIRKMNKHQKEEHIKQAHAFKIGYEQDICYLCGKPFKTISKNEPCLHWLLRQCKFKKKDFHWYTRSMGMETLLHFYAGVQTKNGFIQTLMISKKKRQTEKLSRTQ